MTKSYLQASLSPIHPSHLVTIMGVWKGGKLHVCACPPACTCACLTTGPLSSCKASTAWLGPKHQHARHCSFHPPHLLISAEAAAYVLTVPATASVLTVTALIDLQTKQASNQALTPALASPMSLHAPRTHILTSMLPPPAEHMHTSTSQHPTMQLCTHSVHILIALTDLSTRAIDCPLLPSYVHLQHLPAGSTEASTSFTSRLPLRPPTLTSGQVRWLWLWLVPRPHPRLLIPALIQAVLERPEAAGQQKEREGVGHPACHTSGRGGPRRAVAAACIPYPRPCRRSHWPPSWSSC